MLGGTSSFPEPLLHCDAEFFKLCPTSFLNRLQFGEDQMIYFKRVPEILRTEEFPQLIKDLHCEME